MIENARAACDGEYSADSRERGYGCDRRGRSAAIDQIERSIRGLLRPARSGERHISEINGGRRNGDLILSRDAGSRQGEGARAAHTIVCNRKSRGAASRGAGLESEIDEAFPAGQDRGGRGTGSAFGGIDPREICPGQGRDVADRHSAFSQVFENDAFRRGRHADNLASELLGRWEAYRAGQAGPTSGQD